MQRKFLGFASILDRVNLFACICLLALMVACQSVVIILRYVFGSGILQLQDGAAYCFAMLVVLAIPMAIRRAAHVRVDVFHPLITKSRQDNLETFALVFLLVPVFGLIFFLSIPEVLRAWRIFEASSQIGGLPGYFLIKTMLPVSAALSLLQGMAAWFEEPGPVESTDGY